MVGKRAWQSTMGNASPIEFVSATKERPIFRRAMKSVGAFRRKRTADYGCASSAVRDLIEVAKFLMVTMSFR